MSESQLGVVMNEGLYMLPLLIRVVEDGCGRSCEISWLIEGLILLKRELEPIPDLEFSTFFISQAQLDVSAMYFRREEGLGQ